MESSTETTRESILEESNMEKCHETWQNNAVTKNKCWVFYVLELPQQKTDAKL